MAVRPLESGACRPPVAVEALGPLADAGVRRRLLYAQKRTSQKRESMSASGQLLTHAPQQKGGSNSSMSASTVHSGNPAFRRPSINSIAFDCPPRAIHADIEKAGSTSSSRAAASRASASRPRWAKADARQR